jgi:L-serine deaminase
VQFLLTAGALGMLFKHGASISAAEGGCMAEVGVASSMAAGALAACMGGECRARAALLVTPGRSLTATTCTSGTPKQVMEAAEIAMEQSLGLTCDPVDGLVVSLDLSSMQRLTRPH